MPVTLGGYQSFGQNQVSFSNGGLEVSGLAPGRYIVSPVTVAEGHSENLGAAVFDFTGDETLDLSAFSRAPLAGHIAFEGTDPPPRHPMLFLYPVSSGPPSPISVEPDGTLKRPEGSPLLPGRYELLLENAPGFYLKSVQVNGTEAPAGQIDIPDNGSVQISLLAAKGSTSIDGIALKDAKPLAAAMVLLMPKNLARAGLIRRDQSDSDGTFTLPDVPPGHYTLLAIDNGRDLLYQDPEVMKPYLSQGQDLTVPLPNGAPVKVEVLARQAPAGQSSN